MSVIAERADLSRESLYKALAPGAKPRYDAVLKVLHSLGLKLTGSAARSDEKAPDTSIPPDLYGWRLQPGKNDDLGSAQKQLPLAD